MKRLALITIGLIILGFAYSYINYPLMVNVSGTGEMTISASSYDLSYVVVGSGKDATEAIINLKTKNNSLKTIVKTVGVKDSDIQESQMTVVPAGTVVAGASGFASSISVAIYNIDVKVIETLISSLYAGGASQVSAPQISSSNQTNQAQAAFNYAVKDAEKQADKILSANHKLIKKAVAITQVSSPTTVVTNKSDQGDATKNGVTKLVSTISVTYEMW